MGQLQGDDGCFRSDELGCETGTLAHDDPDDGGVVQQAIEQAGNDSQSDRLRSSMLGCPAEGWSQPRFEELT